jgi:hypothetical protein
LACQADTERAFHGTVQSLSGEPVDAAVTLLGEDGEAHAHADAEGGRFTLLVEAEDACFTVHATGDAGSGASVVCPLSGGLPPVFVADGTEVQVSGQLLDVEGAGVPRQELIFRRHWNGGGPEFERIGTDAEGGFTLTLPSGAWTAEAGLSRFPVLAGGGDALGLMLAPSDDGLVVASTGVGLHLTGPIPSNTDALHVHEGAPTYPLESPTVVWTSSGVVEAVTVEQRRVGIYRVGLESAAPGTVVQLVSADGGGFAQASHESEGLWTALDLDDRILHAEEYGSVLDPTQSEAW